MSKRETICLCLAIAGLSFPPPAQAHTLTAGKARVAANRFLSHTLSGVYRVKSCFRLSRHAYDCVGRATSSCVDVRVRYLGKRSRRTDTHFSSDVYKCP